MRRTLERIGQAIRAGSQYLPIRNYAAALATSAGPKDYLGQATAIYDDLTKRRWRYVKDPVGAELVTYSPQALYSLVLGGDGVGVGAGKGAGDCDCVTALSGALLESIGIKTRLGVTAPMTAGPGRLMSHVFIQGLIPKKGWLTFDPVLYPLRPLGSITDHSRLALFDLAGNLIGRYGNATPDLQGEKEGIDMYNEQMPGEFTDQGPYLGFGETNEMPDDWRKYGLRDYGVHAERLGILGGGGLLAEASYEYVDGQLVSRSPMLELAAEDWEYVRQGNRPYDGMLALGDDAAVYQYDGLGGFFKKLWGGIKKVGHRIASGAKKLIRKLPGGKYLIRLGQKIFKVAMKFVRPLMKFVGKYAAKLAPVAALIPGYGPAIAAALFTAGKVANIMNRYGVVLKGAKGKVRTLKFKKGAKSAKEFKRALEHAAKQEKKKHKKAKAHRRGKTTIRQTPEALRPMIARPRRTVGMARRATSRLV